MQPESISVKQVRSYQTAKMQRTILVDVRIRLEVLVQVSVSSNGQIASLTAKSLTFYLVLLGGSIYIRAMNMSVVDGNAPLQFRGG